MKKTFLSLAAALMVLPALGHADTQGVAEGRNVTSKIVAPGRTVRTVPPHRVIYYITDSAHTGSLIPMVYRRYDNRLDGASNAAVYGSRSIEATGTLDVGAALYKLDSSFTTRR